MYIYMYIYILLYIYIYIIIYIVIYLSLIFFWCAASEPGPASSPISGTMSLQRCNVPHPASAIFQRHSRTLRRFWSCPCHAPATLPNAATLLVLPLQPSLRCYQRDHVTIRNAAGQVRPRNYPVMSLPDNRFRISIWINGLAHLSIHSSY